MNWLSDEAISRLQAASALPDLSGTRYHLLKRVGSGGMGVVYLAEDVVLGRRLALKVLDLPDTSGELVARLLREASILATLEHPGIVPVHDAGTLDDGRAFYAMKFVEGTRLDHLDAQKETLFDLLRIFMRICETVSFAHARGVLHRDLKPGNIMIGSFGEVLVMDWGVAKILRSTISESAVDGLPNRNITAGNGAPSAALLQTAHGTVLGTVGYMSPEQARGEVENLDVRSDIFSLGAILQFLLAKISSETPPLSAVAKKAMSADRAGRYESSSALGQDIGRYLEGLPVSAYPETIFTKLSRWGSRYRVAIVLVLTYLLVRTLLLLWHRH